MQDATERNLAKLADSVDFDESGCWIWTGTTNSKGYGRGRFPGSDTELAHRFAYELLVEEIPAGLQLDHLCRVRNCINPDHLEPVTNRENTLRGERGAGPRVTHCRRGHEYTPANTIWRKRGDGRPGRRCLECARVVGREWKRAKAAS